jgi:hypothetical protein
MSIRLCASLARYVTVLFLVLSIPAIAMADLIGGYRGIDAAEGMRLQFSEEGELLNGTLTDNRGGSQPFSANRLEGGAEATIDQGGRQVYFFMTEEPLGVSVLAIPVSPEGGLISEQTEALVFLKDGVDTPPAPRRFIPPPQGPGGTVDPLAFVDSYAFWPSLNVGYGYEMVRGRYRTLIRLHSVVQTDIVWKLCRGSQSSVGLAEALRGQGVTCDDVLSTFERMMRSDRSVETMNSYRRDVEAQKQALIEAIRCSIDYRRNDPECKRAGARVAKAATSLETVKTVLSRY